MNPLTNCNIYKEGYEDLNCFYTEEIIQKYIYSNESSRDILWLKHVGFRSVFDKIEKNHGWNHNCSFFYLT